MKDWAEWAEEALDYLEMASDQLALASHLAQDRGLSSSCEMIRRETERLRVVRPKA